MNTQMKTALLLCVLVIFSLETAGRVKCHGCSDVRLENTCRKRPFVCNRGKWRSCFIRRIQKNGKIQNISRGCMSFCKTGAFLKGDYEIYLWCCSSDYCNSMNAWF